LGFSPPPGEDGRIKVLMTSIGIRIPRQIFFYVAFIFLGLIFLGLTAFVIVRKVIVDGTKFGPGATLTAFEQNNLYSSREEERGVPQVDKISD
jgi:hypothetical protein